MDSNVIDMLPGTRFRIDAHPRAELCDEAGLLLVAARLCGSIDGEWNVELTALPLANASRPA